MPVWPGGVGARGSHAYAWSRTHGNWTCLYKALPLGQRQCCSEVGLFLRIWFIPCYMQAGPSNALPYQQLVLCSRAQHRPSMHRVTLGGYMHSQKQFFGNACIAQELSCDTSGALLAQAFPRNVLLCLASHGRSGFGDARGCWATWALGICAAVCAGVCLVDAGLG